MLPDTKFVFPQEQNEARKQVMNQVRPDVAAGPRRGQTSNARKVWEDRLNADVVGSQENAESFTKQFMNVMYSGSSSGGSVQQQKREEVTTTDAPNEASTPKTAVPPPALPPKTKIMFSPSRHVFSPPTTLESEDVSTIAKESQEFIPVKEKAKMIALQQEEIIRREETRNQESTGRIAGENLKGGIRLLPPSPQTVRKEYQSDSPQTVKTFESMETASSSSSFQYQSFQQTSSSTQMSSSTTQGHREVSFWFKCATKTIG